MDAKQALEVLANYAETAATEHQTPCDGIREMGECYRCSEFEPIAEAFKALGMKDRAKKWAKACKEIKQKTQR